MAEFDAFHDMEKAGWGDAATAQDYAARFAEATHPSIPVMIQAVHAGQGTRALDLCCGHGNVSRALADVGAVVTGLDFSEPMLELAQAAVPEATFVHGDAMALGFNDDSFDAVTIGFGVPHIPYPERAFAEAHRVLRPGGRIAYSVWEGGRPDSAFSIVFGAIMTLGDPAVKIPPGPGAHDYADAGRAKTALQTAGFHDVARRVVESSWHINDPADPFDFFLNGTVRGRAALLPQPNENKRAIRAAVVDAVSAVCTGSAPWRIPVPSVVLSAVA